MAAILKVKDGNGNVIPIQAIKGEKGDKGDKGDKGEQGIPGTVNGLPSGGYTGQTLVKNSDNNGDISWGGEGLEYDTEIIAPVLTFNGNTSQVRVAPKNKPMYSGQAVTLINSGAEEVQSDAYSEGYALGYALYMSSFVLSSSGSMDRVLTYVENVKTDFEKLLKENYVSNPIYLYVGGIDLVGLSSGVPAIDKGNTVYYDKQTDRSVIQFDSPRRRFQFLYYYDESNIPESYKTSYHVSGKFVCVSAYDSRSESSLPRFVSDSGKVLGINDSGKADYRTPSDLGLLTSSQGVENAGKVLTVGDDGIVVPAASSGGGSYTLPIASSTTLGGVKIGSGISVDETGVISASGGNSEEWKPLINHTVTEAESSENINCWSTDGTDLQGNDVDAKEILIVIKPKLASATRMILQAYQSNSQNRNYLFFDNNRTVLSGNNIECAFHLRAYDIADDNNSSPTPKKVIEFITSKNVYTSYPSLSYGVSGIKINCSKMTGINMRISEDDGTNTLLTGSVIRGWWR